MGPVTGSIWPWLKGVHLTLTLTTGKTASTVLRIG